VPVGRIADSVEARCDAANVPKEEGDEEEQEEQEKDPDRPEYSRVGRVNPPPRRALCVSKTQSTPLHSPSTSNPFWPITPRVVSPSPASITWSKFIPPALGVDRQPWIR